MVRSYFGSLIRELALAFGVVILLTGCGSTDKDRAISGGGIGVVLGTTVGLVLGGPLGGFVLGGATGVATGLVTDQDTIDLGKPIWKKDEQDPENPRRLIDKGNETKAPDNPPSAEIDPNGFDNNFEILD